MGQPAEKLRRATYADILAVPPGKIAELIDGELRVFPRPAPKHISTAAQTTDILRPRFHHGRGGPGEWIILPEPEVHFPDPRSRKGVQVVDPDIAGWRRRRMPELPETAYFPLAPDWICEVLSPSTEDYDRGTKMPLYAENGVRWVWLIDPLARTLEVFGLGEGRRWNEPALYREGAVVRAAPFGEMELDLSLLWKV